MTLFFSWAKPLEESGVGGGGGEGFPHGTRSLFHRAPLRFHSGIQSGGVVLASKAGLPCSPNRIPLLTGFYVTCNCRRRLNELNSDYFVSRLASSVSNRRRPGAVRVGAGIVDRFQSDRPEIKLMFPSQLGWRSHGSIGSNRCGLHRLSRFFCKWIKASLASRRPPPSGWLHRANTTYCY